MGEQRYQLKIAQGMLLSKQDGDVMMEDPQRWVTYNGLEMKEVVAIQEVVVDSIKEIQQLGKFKALLDGKLGEDELDKFEKRNKGKK